MSRTGPRRVAPIITLRSKIREWQDGLTRGEKRVLGIVGPPGVGKTFTLEHLNSEQVAASHFFRLGSGSLQDCFSSLADQIGLASIGEFTERNESEDAKILFRRMLCNPLHQLARPEEGEKFIILDAIDEAEESEILVEIVEEMWEKEMPSWLGLLYSSRPIASFSNVLPLLYQGCGFTTFNTDIESFARSRLSELNLTGNRELEEGVKLIVKQSAGFVVYAHELLVHRLQEYETVGLQELSDLVAEGKFCDDVFQSYCSRLLNRSLNGDHDLYQRLLSILAVAKFPIDQNTLFTLLQDQDSEKILRKAFSEALAIDEKRGVSFPHDSMRKFLLDRKRAGKTLHIKERSGHEQIAAWLLKDETSSLSLQFLIFHLCKANQWEKVRELLLNVDWLHAVVACPEAMETMLQDAQALYIENDVADADAVEVVRAVSLGVKHLTLQPDLLGFELNGRIANRSNPVFRSLSTSKLIARLTLENNNKSFFPASACLEHPHSSVRILTRACPFLATGSTLLASQVFGRTVVKVWDWGAGVCLGELEYGNLWVKLIAVDDDIVAVGCNDLCVRVFAWRTGVCLHVLEGHGEDITCLLVQGDFVASGSRDETILLWSASTGLCLHVLHHSSILQCLAFDRKLLVSGELGSNVNVWDCTSGELLQRVEDLPVGAKSVGILGDVVVTVSKLEIVQVWDWRNGVCLHELEGHSNFVNSVAIDNGFVVSGAEDGTVRVWDLQTGSCSHVLEGHFSEVTHVNLYGDFVISFSKDEVARAWHLPSSKTSSMSDDDTAKYTFSEILSNNQIPDCPAIAFSLSGETLASGHNRPKSNFIIISDAQTNTVHHNLQGPPKGEILAVGYFKDSVAAVFTNPGCVRVWNAASGEMSREFSLKAVWRGVVRAGHSKEISCAAMDGHILATGSKGTSLCLWDMTKGRCLKVLKGSPPTSAVVLAIHGDTVVSGSYHNNDTLAGASIIHVWNWKRNRCEHAFEYRGRVSALAVSDTWVVAGFRWGGISIWDHVTGEAVAGGSTRATSEVLSLSIWKEAIFSVSSDRILQRWTKHETVQEVLSSTVVGAFDEEIGCMAAQEFNGQLCLAVGGESQSALLQEITWRQSLRNS